MKQHGRVFERITGLATEVVMWMGSDFIELGVAN